MTKKILLTISLITCFTFSYSKSKKLKLNPPPSDTASLWKKVCDDFKDCKLVFKDNFIIYSLFLFNFFLF